MATYLPGGQGQARVKLLVAMWLVGVVTWLWGLATPGWRRLESGIVGSWWVEVLTFGLAHGQNGVVYGQK